MAYADPECVPTMAVPRALVLALLPAAALAAPTLVDVAVAAGPAFAAAPAKHGGGRAAEHRAPRGLRSLDRGTVDRGTVGRGAAGRGAAGHHLAPGRATGSNPYTGHGLTIVLPDGRHVRFIEPAPPASAAPAAPPTGSPSAAAPTAAASAGPAPGSGGRGTGSAPGDADPPSGAVTGRTVLPVPVIQSLFPPLAGGAAAGSGAPADASAPGAPPTSDAPPNGGTSATEGTPIGRTGAGAPGAGSAASATAGRLPSAAVTGTGGTAGDAVAPAPAVGRIAPAWPPVPAGPPPLGPQSLARPQPVDLVPPRDAEADYSGTLRHRLLPLGLGLALIGAGAALFGWKLRRL